MSSAHDMLCGDVVSRLLAVLEDVRAELTRVTASNAVLTEQVRRLTEKVEPPKAETAKEVRTRLEMQAILAISDIGPCVKHIAEVIGVSENTLHGWKLFKAAIKREIGQREAARKQAQEEHANPWLGQSW